MSSRAQAFSLEAFVASILLVTSLAFALQAVAVSANTAGPAESELRGQHAGLAEGVVDGAVEDGGLRATVVYWNESGGRFHGATDGGIYRAGAPNTTFGRALEGSLGSQRIRYNVDLYYRGENGTRESRTLVEHGTPTDDAVRVVETVTLYDDTALVAANESRRGNATLGAVESDFYAPDAADDSRLYNVVRVEVIVWRT